MCIFSLKHSKCYGFSVVLVLLPVISLFHKVRWADLEAKKDEQRKREVGFCIGGSWGRVTEEEARAILTGTQTATSEKDNT